ncbi:MAG TPA: hypothetical protein VFW07_22485 [Parafilimonas sp.]|nr:hypothetical protein [Parafilimonas sp.]
MKKPLPVILLVIACFTGRQLSSAQIVKSIGGTNAEYGKSIT